MNYFATLRDQVQSMAIGLVQALPSIAIALVVIVATWLVARFAVRISDAIVGRTQLRANLKELVDTLVKLGIWVIGLFMAAIIVVPGLTPASLLAGLGIGAVAVGFAFKDIFENFLAGVLIMLRENMRIGDVISCEDITGKVEKITLRETHIRKLSGELTIVPNAMLFQNPVEVETDQDILRQELTVGVSYDSDLDHAASVIHEAVENAEDVLASKGIDVMAETFNSSSIDFLVRWWAGSSPREGRESKDAVVRAIKSALDKAGIEMPFPYITHTFRDRVPIAMAAEQRAADA